MDPVRAQAQADGTTTKSNMDFTIATLLQARIDEKPTSQEGEHEYSIQEFGLTNEQVRETLKAYNERFGV